MIEMLLGKKGFLLAHGAGMVKDGKAIVFLGRGGTLKTTIIMNAVRNNLRILGEERLILCTKDDFKAYVFTMWPQIFEHLVNNSLDEDMNISKKVLLFKNLLKERPSSQKVWHNDSAPIESIYLLKRKNSGVNNIEIHPVLKEHAIQKIIANNKAEIYGSQIPSILAKRYFSDYIAAYSFILPGSYIATYWENIERALDKMLDTISIYEIEISGKYSLNIYENILSLIKGIE
jgi:hypothetical protein